jgi:Domain of unknown function (DUF4265)
MTSDRVKILFTVEQDENGPPSVTCEQIWCVPMGQDRYVVDNIPFYARDISLGDEIQTEMRDSDRWFAKLLKPLGNTTVRAFARNQTFGPLLIPRLRAFGGQAEKMEGIHLVAISFPPSADLISALDFLDRETESGNVAFEESSVRYR